MKGRQSLRFVVSLWLATGALAYASSPARARDENRQFIAVLSAEVLSVVQDPRNADIVYAGSRDQGIFKSTDSGATWDSQNNGIQYPWGTQVAMDPNDSQVLYASSQNGLFKTVDGAANWAALPFPYPEATWVATDPVDSNVVYAAPSALHGLFKSTDAGQTWAVADAGLTVVPATALAIDGSNPSTLYAGTWRGGIHKSTDGADSWVNLGMRDLIVYQLVVSTTNSNRVLAACDLGIYESGDGGNTWFAVTPEQPETTLFTCVALDPDNGLHVLAGTNGNGLWETFDGGVTWHVQDVAGMQPWINTIVFAAPGRTLYLGTYEGLFRSSFAVRHQAAGQGAER
jgi:photosystem II stability/assembly factor-like uncharacterized protein